MSQREKRLAEARPRSPPTDKVFMGLKGLIQKLGGRGAILIEALIIVGSLGSTAGAQTCASLHEKTVSISMGFDYAGSGIPALPGAARDREYYARTVGEHVAYQARRLTDQDAKAGKAALLGRLKQMVAGKDYVNFNYTGHGFITRDGEFGIALPTMPKDLVQKCIGKSVRNLSQTERTAGPISLPTGPAECSKLDEHMIKQSELREIFGQKKVFGFADTCHSGGLDLGPNSMMLMASQRNQEAAEVEERAVGKFTESVARDLLTCRSDRDKNGSVSLGEVAARMTYVNNAVNPFGEIKNSQTPVFGSMSRLDERGQRQNPVRTGARGTSWASCVQLAKSRCEAESVSSGEGRGASRRPAASPTRSRR